MEDIQIQESRADPPYMDAPVCFPEIFPEDITTLLDYLLLFNAIKSRMVNTI